MPPSADQPSQTATSSPPLTDPITCGEDVAGDLKRMIEIAPQFCDGCQDYHIFGIAKRLAGHDIWNIESRQTLHDTLAPLLSAAAMRHDGPIDVIAATAANSAILATAAHAAWQAGAEIFGRTRHRVVDRCRSPLILCEEFGARHGLQVTTCVADLLTTYQSFAADIIILHNFLSFISPDHHAALLRRLRSWLKPGGRILIWNMLAPADRHKALTTRWKGQTDDVRSKIDDGSIEINEPKETFFARLDRDIFGARPSAQQFADVRSLTGLLASVGLVAPIAEEILQVRGGRSARFAKIVAHQAPK